MAESLTRPDFKVTVPMEFCLTIDKAIVEKIENGEVSEGDLMKELDYKINSTVKDVLESMSSPEFKDRIVSACWAKIHAPK